MAQEIKISGADVAGADDKQKRYQFFADQWSAEHICTMELPDGFHGLVHRAFRHYSGAGLRLGESQYLKLLKAVEYTYAEMNLIMQIFYMVNADQMNMSMEDYISFKESYADMGKLFNENFASREPEIRAEFDEMESVVERETTPPAVVQGEA